MEDLKIVYLSPDELTPYERNARKHGDEDVDAIVESIRVNGFCDPIGIWGENNLIVEGHGRLLAAKKLGLDRVPCIRLDHLTEEQRREYALAHNQTATLSEWDFDLLKNELADLSFEFDMSAFGFDDIDGLPDFDGEKEITEDEPPEVPEEPKAKLGDIYQLGSHRLMCGDSTDIKAINMLLDCTNPDTYFVDPPYEKEELYEAIPVNDGGRLFVFSDHKHFQKAVSEATNKQWRGRFELVWDCCQSWYTPNRPLARHKTCYVFGDDEHWNFDKAIISDGKQRTEKIVKNTRGDCHYIPLDGAVHMRTVEAFPNTAQNDENGYGKPVKWLAAMLNGYGGDNVFDLFGGSGAVMVACEQIGKTCYTMEIDPHYVDVIIARWENLTGEKAVLL